MTVQRQTSVSKPQNILYGYHPVIEALRSRRRLLKRIYLAGARTGPRREDVRQMALRAGIDLQLVGNDVLDRLAGHGRHQGIVADAGGFPFCSLEEVLAAAHQRDEAPMVLILDQILDPQNLGAMARTLLCSGGHGMVITKDRSAQPTAACSKVSAGAIEHVRISRVTNLFQALSFLKQQGVWIIGADREGGHSLYSMDLTVPMAVIIGGEEKGLRPLVKKQCDYLVSVPQSDTIGSLNASVCAGVMLYETYRQRTFTAGQR